MMDRYGASKNKEGYSDPTPHKVINAEGKKQKAFYVFRTMVSVARLAGFYINDNLTIEDGDGVKYHSKDYLKSKPKPNV